MGLNQNGKQRTAVSVFKKCPRCNSAKIQVCEGEVFCLALQCDWNSIALSVECGNHTFKSYYSVQHDQLGFNVTKKESEITLEQAATIGVA